MPTIAHLFPLTALLLAAPPPARATLQVVATVPDLAALCAEVGGEAVAVTSLARATEDPHFVDARPSFLVALSRADLLVVNGLELEVGWMPALLHNARNARILPGAPGYLDASTALSQKLEVAASPVDRSQGDVHPAGNPHYTFDPRAAVLVVRALRDRLASLDPARAEGYQKRAATFTASLETLAEGERARLGALPAERRRVVPYHRSFPYLLGWLQLSAPIELEPKPGVAPSPAHTARVVSTMRAQGVRVILQEAHYPRSTSETVARLVGAQVVSFPAQTNFHEGQRYADHLRAVSGAIHAALSR